MMDDGCGKIGREELGSLVMVAAGATALMVAP
jgi:hypothetical protein